MPFQICYLELNITSPTEKKVLKQKLGKMKLE